MDKRSLYDGLNQLESELRNTLTELVEMKHALHEIVEKYNFGDGKSTSAGTPAELNQVAQAPAENVKQELSKSRMNLEKFMKKDSMSATIYMDQEGTMTSLVRFV